LADERATLTSYGVPNLSDYSPVATFSFIIHTLSLLGGSAEMQ